jgi:hypothetical protein
MNLIRPRRTFESVVQELIAGLEEGTIVLNKGADGRKSKQRAIDVDFSTGLFGIKVMATPSAEGKARRFGFVNECLLEMIGGRKKLTIDTGPFRGVHAARQSL